MKKVFSYLAVSALLLACNNPGSEEPSDSGEDMNRNQVEKNKSDAVPAVPADAKVFFADLINNDTLICPVYINFGLEGMEVEPAGEVNEGRGHHHLLINGDYVSEGGVIPADSVNIHYGAGQTGDTLDLLPGNYKLTLQFADGYHRSYGKQMSASIDITVVE